MATNYVPGTDTKPAEELTNLLAANLISQALLNSLSDNGGVRSQGLGGAEGTEEPLSNIDQLVNKTDVAWIGQTGGVYLGNLDPNLVKDLNLLIFTNDGVHLYDDGSFKGEVIFESAGNNSFVYDGANSLRVEMAVDPNDLTSRTNSNDTVITGSGADTINTGSGNDYIVAGNGKNLVDAGDGDNRVISGKDADTITTGSGNDTIYSGGGNDSIVSGEGDDYVVAGAGNDTVTAGDGNDSIYGGAGNDKITIGSGDSLVDGGTGNDTITTGDGNDSISGGANNDSIVAGNGSDSILGGSGKDTIIAGSGNDSIDGGAGNDSINAGTGADTVSGGSDKDIIKFSASNNDSIDGGDGDDVIFVTGYEGTGGVAYVDGGQGAKGGTADILNLADVHVLDLTVDKTAKTAVVTLDNNTELHVSNVEKFVYDFNNDGKAETLTLTGVYDFLQNHTLP